jgi:quercetin dioxygenase-like cupin family protein
METTMTDPRTSTDPNVTNRPWIQRASDAERVQDGPTSSIVLLADAEHTDGQLTINRAFLEVGSPGAPAHRHLDTTEAIFVISGSLDVLVEEQVHTLVAGDLVVLPPGTAHAFAPSEGHPADMLAVFTPGQDRFEYYRLLERLHLGSATLQDLAATSHRYDNHYTESDVWANR